MYFQVKDQYMLPFSPTVIRSGQKIHWLLTFCFWFFAHVQSANYELSWKKTKGFLETVHPTKQMNSKTSNNHFGEELFTSQTTKKQPFPCVCSLFFCSLFVGSQLFNQLPKPKRTAGACFCGSAGLYLNGKWWSWFKLMGIYDNHNNIQDHDKCWLTFNTLRHLRSS